MRLPYPKLTKIIDYFDAINPSQFNSPYFYRKGIERHYVKAGKTIPLAVNISKNKTQRKTQGWLETHSMRLYSGFKIGYNARPLSGCPAAIKDANPGEAIGVGGKPLRV